MRRATTAANAILSATVLVALIASPLARADPDAPTPVVTTTAGMVQGEIIDGVYTFKGIPYAADTGGANRWTAPKDPEAWSDVRNATTYIDVCPQDFDGAESVFMGLFKEYNPSEVLFPEDSPKETSEDCLGLNVFAPALDEKLPVMVWIHGGALQADAGSLYPPQAIVKAGDVIVVTINYRLGFLGYFPHPELSEANFGLLDQVKALEWVRDNIESFGGDPSNVTVFGESAGGTSVLALMTSPLSEGLFQRALAQSPGPLSENITVSEAGILGVEVGKEVGVPAGPDQLEKMREVSADSIIDTFNAMTVRGLTGHMMYVDESLPECVPCAFDKGEIHKVPLLLGTNAMENAMFWKLSQVLGGSDPKYHNTTQGYDDWVMSTFGEEANTILDVTEGEYSLTTLSPTHNVLPKLPEGLSKSIETMTDAQFAAQTYLAALDSSGVGNPTYLYYFQQAPKTEKGQTLGAFHGAEAPYLFDHSDNELAKDLKAYWTNFAKTGDPNNGGNGTSETLPEWIAFDAADPHWMVLSEDEIGSEPVPEEKVASYDAINTALEPNILRGLNGGEDMFSE